MPSVSTTRLKATLREVFGANQCAEQKILPDAEMGEETRILEHEPDAAAIGRDEDALGGIDQDAVVEHDAAAIGPRQSGDQADGHRLAGAGATEQSSDAGIAGEGDGEVESAELKATSTLIMQHAPSHRQGIYTLPRLLIH